MKDRNGKHQCDSLCGLSCPKYAAKWIADYFAIDTPWARRQIIRAATEQATNLRAARRYGDSWLQDNGLSLDTYAASVEMLQTAVNQITATRNSHSGV